MLRLSLLKRCALSIVVTSLACAVSVPARADTYYMRLTGSSVSIDGEVTAKSYENWIELSSVGWSVTADTSWTKGGGASVGKPDPGALTWTQAFDSSVPSMYPYILTGKAIPNAVVEYVKDTKSGPTTYLQLNMTGLFFTDISFANSTVSAEGVFKSISVTYWPLDKDGTRDSPVGVNWDIPTGTASPTSVLASVVSGYGPGNVGSGKALAAGLSESISAVPEPETWALLVAGLSAMVLVLRRRTAARVLA